MINLFVCIYRLSLKPGISEENEFRVFRFQLLSPWSFQDRFKVTLVSKPECIFVTATIYGKKVYTSTNKRGNTNDFETSGKKKIISRTHR